MPFLIQINNVAGVKIPIEKNNFTIGRGEEKDLQIDDDLVSRSHAVISFSKSDTASEGAWILSDNGSTNGTFVGEKRVTVHPLVTGDIIRVGKTFLKFLADDHFNPGETRIIKKSVIPGIYYTTDKSS